MIGRYCKTVNFAKTVLLVHLVFWTAKHEDVLDIVPTCFAYYWDKFIWFVFD